MARQHGWKAARADPSCGADSGRRPIPTLRAAPGSVCPEAAWRSTTAPMRSSAPWRDGLKPDPLLTVSEWADRYRVLSQRASSEPGRWRTERTPYLQEIMDCLSPSSPVQRVALMKGAQIGGTECGNCWIGYVIHQAPGPMMAVAPTVELAKRNSKQRIDPLIEESEVLRERVRSAARGTAAIPCSARSFRAGC